MKARLLSGFLIGLILTGMQACTQETLVSEGGDESIEYLLTNNTIKFSSKQLVNKASTRTSEDGNSWETGDLIGIYMLNGAGNYNDSVATITTGTTGNTEAENRRYRVTEDGNYMVPVIWDSPDQAILYPTGATSSPSTYRMKFIAYYPYKRSSSSATTTGVIRLANGDAIYPIDVSNQDDPALIDLLYYQTPPDTAHYLTEPRTTVDFEFKHALARIVINVKKEEDAQISTQGMTAILDRTSPRDSFSLAKGQHRSLSGKAPFYMQGIPPEPGYDTAYQAVVIPQQWNTPKVSFFGGTNRNFNWDIKIPAAAGSPTPEEEDIINNGIEAGKLYKFSLTMKGHKESVQTVSIFPLDALEIIRNEPDSVGEAPDSTIINYVLPKNMDTMRVAYIPMGSFEMGNNSVVVHGSVPATSHKVNINRGFLMGQTPVTNLQFVKFLNYAKTLPSYSYSANTVKANIHSLVEEAPEEAVTLYYNGTTSNFTNGGGRISFDSQNTASVASSVNNHHPVMNVTWYGAMAYASWAGGNLPTEAQWEYAARANLLSSWPYLDKTLNGATMTTAGGYAWAAKTIGTVTSPVGAFASTPLRTNHFGLYDMFGNVWEWTRDTYNVVEDYPLSDDETLEQINPCVKKGDITTGIHPLRGGNYHTPVDKLTIDYRNLSPLFTSEYYGTSTAADTTRAFGFRVAFHADEVNYVSEPQNE
ncbi:MAG: SUMF1/EgtB/PvdO family nonheme iron enzyme [Tannerellaceae bacterium]|nr:SUMF1/EgtB/PvdO family nonheme iron enzyme [Tannerellaceae bacterium]